MGFGVSAVTTAELAEAFPSRSVLGLELDGHRVAEARAAYPSLRFEQGGVEQLPPRGALMIRIANVARGLTKEDAQTLHLRVAPALVNGGVCLEGSTDVEGHLAAFFVLRRRGAEPFDSSPASSSGDGVLRESLVFSTDATRGFSPWQFRDVLPRALRRDVTEGSATHAFFTAWERVWSEVRTDDPRESFLRSAKALAERRSDVELLEDLVRWRLQPLER